jgi:hypothetical protein
MSDLGSQPSEVWKQPGRLPAEGRLGSSENTSNCRFLLPAWPSLHMYHFSGIRSLVSRSRIDLYNSTKETIIHCGKVVRHVPSDLMARIQPLSTSTSGHVKFIGFRLPREWHVCPVD